MKAALTTILTCCILFTFGQENTQENSDGIRIEQKTLIDLYVKALNNRFDLLLQSGWQYIEINEYGRLLRNMEIADRYKFLTTGELIDLSIKEKRAIDILRVVHNIISKDTVDINFGQLRITGKRKLHFYKGLRFKRGYITINCGGTNGYQPDMRFARDASTDEWR
ncbi:hypothetical protein, partial [Sphingobacterium faecale]